MRTDYDADGNIISDASQKRDGAEFNVNEIKAKHKKEGEESDDEQEDPNKATAAGTGLHCTAVYCTWIDFRSICIDLILQ